MGLGESSYCVGTAAEYSTMSFENPSTSLFRSYIRIKSVQPKPDYASCIEFLKTQAGVLGLPYKITSCVESKPIFIMTWAGTDSSLSSVLLNSHTDVVPVFPEYWTYEPFSAFEDDAGNIYGRGTQDMKCVGIQHIEAVRRLKEQGKRFKAMMECRSLCIHQNSRC